MIGLLVGCQSQDRKQEVIISSHGKQELLQGKFVHLSWLIHRTELDLDAVVSQNEEIRRDIEAINTQERFDALVQAIKEGSKHAQGLVSPDGKLVIMSWKTGLEQMGYDVKSMALFKYDGKIKVSSLYGHPKIYDGIQQIKGTNGITFYKLKENGEGKGSSAPNNNAYRISDGYLDPVSVDDTFVAQ
ncbi:hypothetical protein [Flagellimonas marinaquae]